MKAAEVEALVAAGILLVLVLLVKKAAPSVAQTVSDADAAATQAAFSIPGMTLFQDAAGDFDPAQAGYEAGAATRNWFSSLLSSTSTASLPAATQAVSVVDSTGSAPSASDLLYESALMGGG